MYVFKKSIHDIFMHTHLQLYHQRHDIILTLKAAADDAEAAE